MLTYRVVGTVIICCIILRQSLQTLYGNRNPINDKTLLTVVVYNIAYTNTTHTHTLHIRHMGNILIYIILI